MLLSKSAHSSLIPLLLVHTRESLTLCSHSDLIFYISAFLSTPTSVNATLGSTATFNCSVNATRVRYFWLVNGSPLSQLNQSDISSIKDGRTHLLQVPATEEYNNTVVECEVIIRDLQTSDPAVLRVQGMFCL